MAKVFVSIGSNVDRDKHIPEVLKELRETFGPLTVSNVYESVAEGFEGPSFYNLVVAFETSLPLEALLALLKELEIRHGRSKLNQKFASRSLDLDLILYGDRIQRNGKTGHLIVPREDIVRYAFVLEPLAEIAPSLRHPLLNKSYRELWAAFDKSMSRQKIVFPPWQS